MEELWRIQCTTREGNMGEKSLTRCKPIIKKILYFGFSHDYVFALHNLRYKFIEDLNFYAVKQKKRFRKASWVDILTNYLFGCYSKLSNIT